MEEVFVQSHPHNPGYYTLEELRFMDAGSFAWRLSIRTTSWRPPTDVFETDDAYVVRVEIAGMREEDFSIELDGRILTIRGTRPDVPERRAYHQMEIRFGEFGTEVELPGPVVADQVKAHYQDGFLRAVLPKMRSHQVPVRE